MTTGPKPPKDLARTGRAFFRNIAREYRIDADDSAGLALLEVAARSLDRMEQARAEISKYGLLVTVVVGDAETLRANPAIKIEVDSRNGFLASVRAMRLDVEPLKSVIGRPPGDSRFPQNAATARGSAPSGSVTKIGPRS